MASQLTVSDFIQRELSSRRLETTTAVEAAQWLDAAGVLKDSPHRAGNAPRFRLTKIGASAFASPRSAISRRQTFAGIRMTRVFPPLPNTDTCPPLVRSAQSPHFMPAISLTRTPVAYSSVSMTELRGWCGSRSTGGPRWRHTSVRGASSVWT